MYLKLHELVKRESILQLRTARRRRLPNILLMPVFTICFSPKSGLEEKLAGPVMFYVELT